MLNQKVALYIPTEYDNGSLRCHSTHYQAQAQEWMAQGFGGCTLVRGFGAWLDAEKNLVEEPVVIIHSFTDAETLKHGIKHFRDLAASIGNSMNQDCIAIEINGTLEFIERIK